MYWYKLPKPNAILITALCFALLAGCKPEVRQNGSMAYFDIKKYFTAEAARLSAVNPPVLKSVTYNNEAEQKTVRIKSWQHELDLFTSSDINKPAWRNSYKVLKTPGSIVYTAIDTNLKTRYIAIRQSGGKVKQIDVVNFTKNLLYQTRENLSYYPDSVYRIEKKQRVKILGVNNYMIRGKLNSKY